jgi:hypothetical protein
MNVYLKKVIKKYQIKDYSSPILEMRQKTIISWLSNSIYDFDGVALQSCLRDIYSENEDVYNDLKKNNSQVSILSSDEECFLTHTDYYQRSTQKRKEKDNKDKRILRKYISSDFEDRLFDFFMETRSIANVQEKIFKITRNILGENICSKMYEEFEENRKKRKSNSYGVALTHYVINILVKKIKMIEKKKDILKQCKYCSRSFYPTMIDSSLKQFYPAYMKIEDICFCQGCLKSAFLGIYKSEKEKKQLKEDIQRLITSLGFIPLQNYFGNTFFSKSIPKEKFDDVIIALIEILPYEIKIFTFEDVKRGHQELGNYGFLNYKDNCYKRFYGSWFKTLIETGILDKGIRKTERGTMCISKDEHLCLSISEKNVDDWFYDNDVEHIK